MARIKTLAGLPIEQHNSPNVGGAMSDHRGSVLHIAEGTYEGTISWQMNPDQRYADGTSVTTSSTWVVGKNRGEWAQMVDTDVIAWCQRSGSKTRNSIELAGHSGDKPTAWQIEACAQIFAWEHLKHGVPLQVADTDAVLGLCHHSADREWAGVEWGHEDCPGKGVIAAKPAIVARAKQIIEGDDMTTIAEIKTLLMTDKQLRASLAVLPWQADIIPRGVPADDPNPNMTTGFTLGFILTVIGRLTPRLDEILAAAQDDGDTNVVLDPASLVALQELRDSIAGVPAAVADEQAKRLGS